MWSETILAISDILAARPDWRDVGGALLDAFDAIPLRSLRESAVALRPWPVRHTLRGLIYARPEAAMAIREAAFALRSEVDQAAILYDFGSESTGITLSAATERICLREGSVRS